jgi:hypothetical protein
MSETQSDVETDEPKVDKKQRAEVDKERAEANKKAVEEAEEQAERDAADIETFLSFHRGEKVLRGENGSFDHAAYQAERDAEGTKD